METKGCKDTYFSNSTAPILISVTKIAEYPVSGFYFYFSRYPAKSVPFLWYCAFLIYIVQWGCSTKRLETLPGLDERTSRNHTKQRNTLHLSKFSVAKQNFLRIVHCFCSNQIPVQHVVFVSVVIMYYSTRYLSPSFSPVSATERISPLSPISLVPGSELENNCFFFFT